MNVNFTTITGTVNVLLSLVFLKSFKQFKNVNLIDNHLLQNTFGKVKTGGIGPDQKILFCIIFDC